MGGARGATRPLCFLLAAPLWPLGLTIRPHFPISFASDVAMGGAVMKTLVMIFHQRLSMQSTITIFWPAGSELLAGPVVSTSEALVDAQRELQATRAESERRGDRIALLEAELAQSKAAAKRQGTQEPALPEEGTQEPASGSTAPGAPMSAGDQTWVCSMFSGEGIGGCDTVAQARDNFLAEVGAATGSTAGGPQLLGRDAVAIGQSKFADAGAAFFGVVAAAITEQQALESSVAAVSTAAKDAGEFTFGDQKDFEGGVQGMIGFPKGLNVAQCEFCGHFDVFLHLAHASWLQLVAERDASPW